MILSIRYKLCNSWLVSENLDIEKMRVIIDTLRGVNLKGENKIDGVFEFNLKKAETNNNPENP